MRNMPDFFLFIFFFFLLILHFIIISFYLIREIACCEGVSWMQESQVSKHTLVYVLFPYCSRF